MRFLVLVATTAALAAASAPALADPPPSPVQMETKPANLEPVAFMTAFTGFSGMITSIALACVGAGCPIDGPTKPIHFSPGVVAGTIVGGAVISPALFVGGLALHASNAKRQAEWLRAHPVAVGAMAFPSGGGVGVRAAF